MSNLGTRRFRTLCMLAGLVAYWHITAPAPGAQQVSEQGPRSPGPRVGLREAKLSVTQTEVLDGRLTVRMPQVDHPDDLLDFTFWESEDVQTTLAFDSGEERLVLRAREVFAMAGDDLSDDVVRWIPSWGEGAKARYRVEPVELAAKGLKAVSVTPLSPDYSRLHDHAFIEGLVVETPDRTIRTIDVYANRTAARDPEACRSLAHKILVTVALGPKTLQLGAGVRRLEFSEEEGLYISMTVPQGVATTREMNIDFLIYRVIVLGPLGSDSGRLGMYIGNHPSFQPGKSVGKGTLFGKQVEWYLDGKGNLEALCVIPNIDGNVLGRTKSHIWIYAPSNSQREALKRVAESIKLVEGPVVKLDEN